MITKINIPVFLNGVSIMHLKDFLCKSINKTIFGEWGKLSCFIFNVIGYNDSLLAVSVFGEAIDSLKPRGYLDPGWVPYQHQYFLLPAA